ncbi:siderophore-interacting protein [Gemmobacter serpentinus]|uniref:siderophore-interacting protein n=1 Tax=Gemmobacter serpentinus TaxID=2652247 RepID=UPI00124F68FF|nr:siderophore-interacting protein [Gemmobacter serpentinus]
MSALGEYRSSGLIDQGAGAAAAALRARAVEWELEVSDADGFLQIPLWGGTLSLGLAGEGARLTIRAPEKRVVQFIRDAVAEVLEAEGVTVGWDHVDAGALPPGVALMQVERITEFSPTYLRVRLRGADCTRYASTGLHFRLLLAPEGRAPVWPVIGVNGRTVWPDGADALHRPVYTAAAQGEDWLDFDIFRHAGSPTCDWAARNPVGVTVGVMGPGGGMCPEASDLLLFGDETALPAMRRMLDLAPGRVSAVLRARREDIADLAQDIRVTCVPDLLVALMAANPEPAPGRHVWFAGRDDDARAARAFLSGRGFAKRDFTAAAYWG